MRCVYQHWQHGRLVEGDIAAYNGYPLNMMVVFALPLTNLLVLLKLMEQGGLPAEPPCVPKVWYELTWCDGETAYYKMANRWRG